jgi:hypothetical protein
LAHVVGRRLDGQISRQQVVARISGFHAHDFAARAQVIDIFA